MTADATEKTVKRKEGEVLQFDTTMSLHLCAQIDNTSGSLASIMAILSGVAMAISVPSDPLADRNGPCSVSLETYLALLSAWSGDKNTRVRFKKVHGHGVHNHQQSLGIGRGTATDMPTTGRILMRLSKRLSQRLLEHLHASFAQILGMVRSATPPYKVPVACWRGNPWSRYTKSFVADMQRLT